MLKKKRLFLVLTTLTLANWLMAPAIWAQDAELQRLLNPPNLSVESSVDLIRLKDAKVLFEYQPDQILTPASVTKLVTSAALLQYFSPAKTFKTNVYYTGTKKRGVISGDLYFVGDGDPFLVSEKLWQFAADLRQMGIVQVRGKVIIDNSLFDDEYLDVSRMEGATHSSNAYDAPISALGINFNTVAVSVAPSETAGASPLVTLDPYLLEAVRIKNNSKTRKGSGANLGAERANNRVGEKLQITVNGQIGQNADLQKIYRSVPDPVTIAGDYIKTFLRHEGIQVLGGIESAVLKDPKANLLYTITSYPMQRLVEGLNKFSNNFIADVLTKRLGAEFPSKGEAPLAKGSGTFKNGAEVLNRFLNEDVRVKSDFVLKNGSGLNTGNLLSSRQMTKVLSYMTGRLDIFPEFIASLPSAGLDGTLKKRFKGKDISGFIRAKTGTLSQPIAVVSLAGYVQHPSHGLCAFSIIQNGKAKAKQPGIEELRNLQDEVLAYFITKL